MSNATLSPEQAMAQVYLDDLGVIAEQYEAGKDQTAGMRANKRALVAMANKLDDLKDELVDRGVEEELLATTATLIDQWAELILPTKSVPAPGAE